MALVAEPLHLRDLPCKATRTDFVRSIGTTLPETNIAPANQHFSVRLVTFSRSFVCANFPNNCTESLQWCYFIGSPVLPGEVEVNETVEADDRLGGRYVALENIAAGNYGSVVKMKDMATCFERIWRNWRGTWEKYAFLLLCYVLLFQTEPWDRMKHIWRFKQWRTWIRWIYKSLDMCRILNHAKLAPPSKQKDKHSAIVGKLFGNKQIRCMLLGSRKSCCWWAQALGHRQSSGSEEFVSTHRGLPVLESLRQVRDLVSKEIRFASVCSVLSFTMFYTNNFTLWAQACQEGLSSFSLREISALTQPGFTLHPDSHQLLQLEPITVSIQLLRRLLTRSWSMLELNPPQVMKFQ